jgi:hypothetical protein
VNPLSVTRLFAQGRKLGLLSASAGFACFVDGSSLNDIVQMWIKVDVPDMSVASNALYLSLWGGGGGGRGRRAGCSSLPC